MELIMLVAWGVLALVFLLAVGFVFYVAYRHIAQPDVAIRRELAEAQETIKNLSLEATAVNQVK